jgi:vancomycin resistance protein YoaR
MVRERRPTPPYRLFQVVIAMVGGITLFFILVLLWIAGYNMAHAGRIYPGISVAGIAVDGMEPYEAAALLAAEVSYPHTGRIAFQDQGEIWIARPVELGLSLDAAASAQQAYELGRSGNPLRRFTEQLGAWYSSVDLPPMMAYNEQAAYTYLETLAAGVNKPVVEASLSIEGEEVVALPGQVGRQVDIQATSASLATQFGTLTDGLMPLVVEETPPEIMDVSQQADKARQILSAPLTLRMPEGIQDELGPWVIPPHQLARMLIVERAQGDNGAAYQVVLDREALDTYLSALVPDIARQPGNARFIFNDDTLQLDLMQPAVIGRSLDVQTSIEEINQTVMGGGHDVSLSVQYIQPEVGDEATGDQLGITEQVIAYSTYFRGSTAERLQNIQTAAANFHGLLVPPGGTFSMAANMGDVTLDNGYAEAWIIFGGRTIKGVGGGVCQVSTTLFRTVFFSGFPVVERHPHAYRVGYYEQTAGGYNDELAGLDATVYVPMVDFQFVNDTPHWLLMETYFNAAARRLTWKFYSTKDGRTVHWNTTGLKNVVEPPDPIYEENPDLAKGEIKQVDWAAEGADVEVTRFVYRDDVLMFSDEFTTHYMPWRDIYQYGPGTKIPKKYRTNGALDLPEIFQ